MGILCLLHRSAHGFMIRIVTFYGQGLFNIFWKTGSRQKIFTAEDAENAEGPYFSLRASAVFRTIPEDNKKSHFCGELFTNHN